MSAGQEVGPLDREGRSLIQPPLPPDEATRALAAAAGVSTVGLRPSFVTPAAAHSHPDCRAILILIVAPHDGDVPDHSTFSKNRHGRFRESDLLRKLFETVVARCMKEGIVGGEAFAVDASIIVADAHRRRSVAKIEDLDPTSNRAVAEYLSVLDDAAFGGATPVEPKVISPTDPAARYTASANSVAGYAYSDNYLIDLKHAVIMDVEATTTIRQAEVGAAKTMLDRTAEQFDVTPSRLVADAGYGSAEMVGWLVDERGIEPHVKLMDKAERTDGTLSRSDFAFDPERNLYVCPGGKELKKYHRAFAKPRDGLTKDGTMIYFARKQDCEACALKPKCCLNVPARKIARSVHEAARDKARAIAKTEAYAVSRRERRLQGELLDQAFGGKKAKVAYVMGIAGTSPQILRAKGWDEFRANNPQYEEVARVNDDFDAAKALAVVQDLLSRFPKGQLDAIIMQGPEASAAVDFALRNGRDEVKFIVGDYPQDVRQLIHDGKIFGTVDQDPYPQAYNAMKMAWLHFNGKDADIQKPYFLPLPLITKENAEKTPAAWGC